ncbi:hypothetical protein TWF481_006077 [Arthrobotrys musiformis]|uniref:Apple domain-containing protein n=1 Tax=Arthrobotrys musiformis TaxID=47236 RepID=A0AAV9WHA5_9PEZI
MAAPECCLRCFILLDCIAYVSYDGNCILLTVIGDPTSPTSPMCPNGIKRTYFGTPPGAVGKGPCQAP